MINLKFLKISALIFLITLSLTSCSSILTDETDSFEIHFIDINQGDAMLIRTPAQKNILIDSGSKKNDYLLFSYLNNFFIDSFDIVIATHPDEDHIGSMERIIEEYDISEFYMPDKIHTTNTYKYMLEALKDNNIPVKIAKEGQVIVVDEDTKIYILHPDESFYDDNNDYSIVTKIVYKNYSFLLTGDIDSDIEQKLVNKYNDFLKSDVLKLAHHGSSSSSSKIFLKTVSPLAAIISAGKNNDYSHPHKEVIQNLKSLDIPVYRTDEQGTIVFYANESSLSVNLDSPGSYKYGSYKK